MSECGAARRGAVSQSSTVRFGWRHVVVTHIGVGTRTRGRRS
jgi:hypothetical protein